jgi:flavin-dependent thymidylate synthase
VLKVICPPSIAEVPPGTLVVAETTPTDRGVDWESMWEDNVDYTYRLVAPDALATTDRLISIERFRRWAYAIIRAYGRYLWLREQKVPAEDARFVLPNAAKTEIGMTANARQWRHVFTMRCDKHAQWEIRGLMQKALGIMAEAMPIVFDDERMLALRT